MHNTKRLSIVAGNKLQCSLDNRPRCESCFKILTWSDFESYYDGQNLKDVPSVCEHCAEQATP